MSHTALALQGAISWQAAHQLRKGWGVDGVVI